MEKFTQHHFNRIRALSRHALRLVERAQQPSTKGEKHAPLDLIVLTQDLLLIQENARMVQKLEHLPEEPEADVDQTGTARVA